MHNEYKTNSSLSSKKFPRALFLANAVKQKYFNQNYERA